VYGVQPRIPLDPNKPITNETPAEVEPRLTKVNHIRSLAKELLLNRAIQINHIRDEKVTETSLEPGA
jgi:hypothetical protein